MPRLTQLDEVLFPVEEWPVYVNAIVNASERRLPVPGRKAIVNASNSRVLGIVSQGYRLVTNREALDFALECCRAVFPETKPDEWGVKTTDAPSTGGHCNIDLVHNSTSLDFSDVPAAQRPEVYGPFIRVTNSYNGLRSLSFDIGFYRKVCMNGLILPDAIIHFKFAHVRREIGKNIKFEIDHEKLIRVRNSLAGLFDVIRKFSLLEEDFEPLVCGVLGLRTPKPLEPDTQQADEWERLIDHLREIEARYRRELGESAYSAFNVITEFASNPPANRFVRRERNSLQRLAGSWFSSFSNQCCQPGFRFQDHLAELAKSKPRFERI